ncbi:hypothetical protein F5Y15DRAFT_429560 [Xylariaceae sp. FL0016]|nr:hypothetical protein F5Y15DRAFT_429560 [Xylariaceae sp. FL0016]
MSFNLNNYASIEHHQMTDVPNEESAIFARNAAKVTDEVIASIKSNLSRNELTQLLQPHLNYVDAGYQPDHEDFERFVAGQNQAIEAYDANSDGMDMDAELAAVPEPRPQEDDIAQLPLEPRRQSQAHQSAREFSCSICNKMLKSRATLTSHMEVHVGTVCYWQGCGRTIAGREAMVSHLKQHNDAYAAADVNRIEGKYKCYWHNCGKDYRLLQRARRHVRLHNARANAANAAGSAVAPAGPGSSVSAANDSGGEPDVEFSFLDAAYSEPEPSDDSDYQP